MKNHVLKIFLFTIVICNSEFYQLSAQGNWTPKANFAGVGRLRAIGFSIGNKGYVGLGAGQLQDFWEWNQNTNVWTQKANFAGISRDDAVGFSIGNKGYVGLGTNSGTGNLLDFWQYNPNTNSWAQKANFGGVGRFYAVGFSIGNKGYVATGASGRRDVWEYNPSSNAWAQKADYGGGYRITACAFSIGNIGYMGTGVDSTSGRSKAFYKYNPSTNVWTQIADFPLKIDQASTFTIGSRGYVCGGADDNGALQTLYAYDPLNNKWIQKAFFPGGIRFGSVGFAVNNKGYIVTGGDGNGASPIDFWQYSPDSGLACTSTITASGTTNFCNGGSVTFTANAGGSYLWNNGLTTQSIKVVYTGSYNVTVDACTSSVSLIVNVYPIPSVYLSLSGPTTFCSGKDVIVAVNPGTGSLYQWFNSSTAISGATLSSYKATSSGLYKVRKTNSNGCSKTSTGVSVIVNSLPNSAITASGSLSFCVGDSVNLTASSGTNYLYQWKKNNSSISSANNINYTAKLAGNYTVKVTNANGCTKISPQVTVTTPCRETYQFYSESPTLQVFPQPVKDIFTLKANGFSGMGMVNLINASGQTVMTLEINFDRDNQRSFDMSGFQPGLYLLVITNKEKREMVRMIKE